MRRIGPYLGLATVLILGLGSLLQGVLASWERPPRSGVIRVGFCPNLTHGPVLLGLGEDEPSYRSSAGLGRPVEGHLFESGPFMVQALFAGEIDVAAMGPNPAVNGYVRSRGEAVRIVAGCASGGAGLVVRGRDVRAERDAAGRIVAIAGPEGRRTVAEYFAGRTLATPSIANTQDLAARAWLAGYGLKPLEEGGSVRLVPVSNAEQLTLFRTGEIDAAWAPEPWLSRLAHSEGGGTVLIDERELWPMGRMAATVLVAHPRFLREHPDDARRLVAAHARIVDWINRNPDEARARIAGQIRRHTLNTLPPEVVRDAFGRVTFTVDPLPDTVEVMARRAFDAGFLGRNWLDLSRAYDLTFLTKAGSP